VHPAQRALAVVERDVALLDHGIEPGVDELLAAEGAGEEAAVVLAQFQVDGFSCFRRVWPRPVKVSPSSWMLLNTSYSWRAPRAAFHSQEKPGSRLVILSKFTV
jgi:hypothetical protein